MKHLLFYSFQPLLIPYTLASRLLSKFPKFGLTYFCCFFYSGHIRHFVLAFSDQNYLTFLEQLFIGAESKFQPHAHFFGRGLYSSELIFMRINLDNRRMETYLRGHML